MVFKLQVLTHFAWLCWCMYLDDIISIWAEGLKNVEITFIKPSLQQTVFTKKLISLDILYHKIKIITNHKIPYLKNQAICINLMTCQLHNQTIRLKKNCSNADNLKLKLFNLEQCLINKTCRSENGYSQIHKVNTIGRKLKWLLTNSQSKYYWKKTILSKRQKQIK